MCRWLAYHGSPLPLSALLTRPDHSLIDQSREALQNVVTTNGDGFGVGWYLHGDRHPGTFRDTHPAWNNQNLRHLARHIRSPLFLAHVRAATGTPVQETNCHPFRFERWLFQHNGSVPHFARVKRRLLFDVAPELFPHVAGSTDSELLFFLALTFGLRDDPQLALERTIGHVASVLRDAGIGQPLTFSAATTDGERLFAVRWSGAGDPPTLFHSCHVHALRAIDGTYDALPDDAVVLLSEPLDELAEHWESVPPSSFVAVEDGQVTIEPFVPRKVK
ncbi:MAG: class II glutamine amidotransferase [Planctomycetes bacterium]|nr:class II glutamine amidotransferase [Planctomycetota bacterium]